MAVSDAYATAEQYRRTYGKQDDGSDAEIALALKAVSRAVDRRLGRFFTRDDEPTVRRYACTRTGWIVTTDMAEAPLSVIARLDSVERTLEADVDYWLWPANALEGPEPRPYEGLHVGWSCFWPQRQQLRITVPWGWPQIPEMVQLHTMEITAIWRLESPRATTRVTELEQTIATSRVANSLVKDLVDTYQRKDWGFV